MGSETTLPYAWLLWRFKNTLANPVTWCCRCLYDMLRKVNFAKSAQREYQEWPEGHLKMRAQCLSCCISETSYKKLNARTQNNLRSSNHWVLSSYLIAIAKLLTRATILLSCVVRRFDTQLIAIRNMLCVVWITHVFAVNAVLTKLLCVCVIEWNSYVLAKLSLSYP